MGRGLTYPLSPNEERRAGRLELEFMTAGAPRRPAKGGAQKRRPDRCTNYLLGRGGSFVTGRAMLR